MSLTAEQERAVARRDGSLMVRAGAGTGKTTVLVERFARAVVDDGVAVEAILAITFTEKAAAEMKARVRARFLELGRREEARAAEAAWISTIHGFCSRVLRAHALSAGIDPGFRVLDELEAERVATDAFDAALGTFMGEGEDPQRLEMVAAYTPDRLRDMVRTAHARLRSRGERFPRLAEAQPPRAADQPTRLESAARAALAELRCVPVSASVTTAMKAIERCLAVLERYPSPAAPAASPSPAAAPSPALLPEPAELDGLSFAGRAKVLCTATCDEYREALAAYTALCTARREFLDHTMLRVLLDLYGERYEEGKRRRSGLDFEDLELIARDLLAGSEGLREQYASRFAHVLVDEYQDTNPLQNELLELLGRDNLFRVGDERQSIYGFRHADVEVFRGHWTGAAEAARAESITVNFRSRGEVLDAIDLAFERVWDDFEPLREAPGARDEAPAVDPCVELLVTDRHKGRWDEALGTEEPFGAAMRGATPWRAAEARLLARRIEELAREGGFEWRDVVVLLRATTHMVHYERALEERGIPTHVVGGRGYWTQQQVADLRHWLAALANPLDELAVYSVLASPLAGLSLDAVALLGLHARAARRDPWWALREAVGNNGSDPDWVRHETSDMGTQRDEPPLAALLPAADRRRAASFVALFEAERQAAPQVSLETLIDRAVTKTGYDTHVLSLPAGTRRMANVRKLMRMAREFEADEGRDLRGFIDALTERDVLQSREGEAPLEAEALDAVRLMTVHRAKGLEFPVVCVADLGKDGREDDGSLRISDDGSLGLRLASIGGGSVDSAELERIKAEQKTAGEAEEKRIFYVAVTRAQRHLLLSGATDLEALHEPDELKEPMRWAIRGFCESAMTTSEPEGLHLGEREGRPVRVRWSRLTPDTADELLPAADRAPARAEPEPAGGARQPELGLAALPAPRALPVSRLSYTGLEDYRRCSYRFYLEKALRLPRVDPPLAADPLPETGIGPRLRGTLVHQLLERLDIRRPRVPDAAEVEALAGTHGVTLSGDEVADLRDMVERFAGSELRERLARARRVRSELPFAFTLEPPGAGGRNVLVNGVVDVHAAEDDGLLVVDYKSDVLNGNDPAELTARDYSTQRLVYALAGLRGGAERVEVVHCFLEQPAIPAAATFDAGDASRLEKELLDLARGVVDGRFVPTEEPHAELCATCPGRAALCSWPEERTLASLSVGDHS